MLMLHTLWSVRLVVLAVAGVICVAVGVAMIYAPAGMITAGVGALSVAYVTRYLDVMSDTDDVRSTLRTGPQ